VRGILGLLYLHGEQDTSLWDVQARWLQKMNAGLELWRLPLTLLRGKRSVLRGVLGYSRPRISRDLAVYVSVIINCYDSDEQTNLKAGHDAPTK
jgi:hypothetical protein